MSAQHVPAAESKFTEPVYRPTCSCGNRRHIELGTTTYLAGLGIGLIIYRQDL